MLTLNGHNRCRPVSIWHWFVYLHVLYVVALVLGLMVMCVGPHVGSSVAMHGVGNSYSNNHTRTT